MMLRRMEGGGRRAMGEQTAASLREVLSLMWAEKRKRRGRK